MDSIGEGAGEGFDMRRGGVAMLRDDVDEGRSDDDAVGDARDLRGLFGRADAEAHRDGQVGRGFQARDGFVDARLRGLLLAGNPRRSEEHTSELQSLMRISYAVFCLKKKTTTPQLHPTKHTHD